MPFSLHGVGAMEILVSVYYTEQISFQEWKINDYFVVSSLPGKRVCENVSILPFVTFDNTLYQ